MKKVLFICESLYQTFNILNLVYHKSDSEDYSADLYISEQVEGADIISQRIKASGLINNVWLLKRTEHNLMPRGFKRNMLFVNYLLRPIHFLKKIRKDPNMPIPYNVYDTVFAVMIPPAASAVLQINPSAELFLYEDGTGSYMSNIIFDSSWKLKYLKFLFCRIFKCGVYARKPSGIYVNNVPLCKTVLTKNIMPLPKPDDKFIEFANKIFFGSSTIKNINQKIIWLTQNIDMWLPDDSKKDIISQREILTETLTPYKNDTLLRIHYRETNRDYFNGKFDIDSGRDLWELKILQIDIDNKILIANYSTAQITPKLLFDKEPFLIFTHHLTQISMQNKLHDIDSRIGDIKKLYRNPEKIAVIHDVDELNSALKRFMNCLK